jgi:excisionase family DNA binding protein
MSRPDELRLYTVGDVEQRLQLSRAKVYDLIRTGRLASLTIGRSRRVTHTALNNLITTLENEGL